MRKVLLPILLVLVGIGLVLSLFQGPLAMRVMRAGLESNMSRDPLAAFDDGLHAVLCGAGGPLPGGRRSAPCLAIIAGTHVFIVDAGSGAARNLVAQGLQPPLVEGVFLTHFHSDHIDGLGELGLLRWTGSGSKMPLPLFGAEGVAEIARGINQTYRLDAIYRTAHHGSEIVPPTGAGFEAKPFEEPADGVSTVVLDKNGLQVTAFRVEHDPVKPAVGYRFEYAGRSIVVSGDTAKSANLEKMAKGADLLIHEALSRELMSVVAESAKATGNTSMAKIAADVLTYHASPVEAAQSAEAAEVGHLLYYHVVPPMPLPGLSSVFLDGVSDAYGGPVTLGQDGTRISLPRNSDEIVVVSE